MREAAPNRSGRISGSYPLSGRTLGAGSAAPLPIAIIAALLLTACSESQPAEQAVAPAEEPQETRTLPGSLEWAVEGAWRLPEERARDAALHPVEVARALALDDVESVIELAPGAGDWTAIVAPVVAARGGAYAVVFTPLGEAEEEFALSESFRARFADQSVFGSIAVADLGSGPVVEPGSVEAAFTVDDVAVWMALGQAEAAFAAAYEALEPGGSLGVVQPRAPADQSQDPGATSGYVRQDHMVRLAEEAGFALEGSSDLLANPADTADHPFGAWTLAPYRLTAPLGQAPDPGFDRAPYDAIGEPDRMVLVFRKPRA
jgi:predicted methyltransferase